MAILVPVRRVMMNINRDALSSSSLFLSSDQDNRSRSEVLRSYGLIDSPDEASFDRIAALAARVFNVPTVLISVVDEERQWFKSCIGTRHYEAAREIPFCTRIVETDAPLVVFDACDDARFADHPLVSGDAHLRFCAGVPLRVEGGVTMGTLCLMDVQARAFGEQDLSQLWELAAMIVETMDLRYSERLYRSLIEGGSEMVTIFDESGIVIYQSPSITRLFGYDVDEFTGGGMNDLVHPDDLPDMRERYLYMVENKADIPSHRFRFRHKNGAWRMLECYTRYRMDDPQIGGIVSTARDVTDHVETQQQLDLSEERFEATFQQSAVGMALVALDGKFMRINGIFSEMSGIPTALADAHHYSELMAPEEVENAENNGAKLLNGEAKSLVIERPLVRLDGPTSWAQFTVSLVTDGEGGPSCFLVQVQDIDERRKQTDRLRLLESIAVNANDAILITEAEPVDEPGPRILYANEAYLRMTGYTLDEVLGKTPRIMQGEDTDPASRDEIRRALKRWKPVVVELLNYHKDGTPFWVEISIVPVANEVGWFTHWVSVQRDVTERKETEAMLIRTKEEAEAAREEAENANRAKSDFLSRMSHELRTPLNAILGFGQLLEMEEQTPENAESTEQILKAGRHLLELINEVLDISRIESGRMAMSLEPVSVAEVARETLDLVRSMATQYGVTLHDKEILSSPLAMLGDRRRVKQILLNLLSNAIKYNREGGQVKLSLERVMGEDYDRDSGNLRFCISDDGAGIAPEKSERLWVPFDRLDAEHSGIEGTGIGLALSRRLAGAMQGELDFRSGETGSTFWLELPLIAPLALADGGAMEGIMPATAPPVSTRWVALYIEDNLPNVQLVQGILARRPEVRLLTAMQGSLGVELAGQHCPDIILLDLHLPDINGDEVLRRLRENPDTRHIPVVMISADATPGQIERLMAAGADDYLSKPFDIGHFLGVLDGCIARGEEAALQREQMPQLAEV